MLDRKGRVGGPHEYGGSPCTAMYGGLFVAQRDYQEQMLLNGGISGCQLGQYADASRMHGMTQPADSEVTQDQCEPRYNVIAFVINGLTRMKANPRISCGSILKKVAQCRPLPRLTRHPITPSV